MRNLILIFIAGAFSALAMAPTNFWPALFIGISSLYISIHRSATPKNAALIGFIFSLGYFGFSLIWVGNALLIEDNPYVWAWPLAVSGLPALLSLFTATGCYVYKKLYKNTNNFLSYFAFSTCLFISEYARGHLLTGFPWNLYGYTWIDILPIAQIASLSNIYLLTLLTIFWTGAPGFLLTSRQSILTKTLITALLLGSVGASFIYGLNRIHNNPTRFNNQVQIIIVQPNIAQSEKWKPENRGKNFVNQIDLSQYSPPKNSQDAPPSTKQTYYIIWPETAISQDIIDTAWTKKYISNMLLTYPGEAYLITGALRYEQNQDQESNTYFNSIITFNNKAEVINTYDKSHLVPFGEYMPFENIFNIAPIVGFTGFKQGAGQKIIKIPEGLKFIPLICYEIIFPNTRLKALPSSPDVIINLTNDGWYGDSPGPYQHLVQTQFRAIETGLPILRSANTGISAIITPLGEVLSFEKISQKSAIKQKLPHRITSDIQENYSEKGIILFLILFLILNNTQRIIINNSGLKKKLNKSQI